jgi:hypothetical protein
MTDRARQFFQRGWCAFDHDPVLADWVAAVRPVAEATLHDPELRSQWLRCGGTWFAGVNALPNDASGAVPGRNVPPLAGMAIDFIGSVLDLRRTVWDKAQVSICFPGYPQPWQGENESAHRFRRDRDAAHLDGLRRSEPGRRRNLDETHAFILGIPLTETRPDASPFIIYEGSHELMRRALRARLKGIAPADWPGEDITDAYVAARREAFKTCRRVLVHGRPGQAYLAHRLVLHGVAPWGASLETGPRMIVYFRPDLTENTAVGEALDGWLERP